MWRAVARTTMRSPLPGALEVFRHALYDFEARDRRRFFAVERLVHLRQEPGIMIGGAPEHDAVDALVDALLRLFDRGDRAVHDDGRFGEVALQHRRVFGTKGRNLTVFLGTQTLKPGRAGMHDEDPRARFIERSHEVEHEPVVVAPVDAHAVLHGDGLLGGVAHGGETLRDERRVEHERSPKAPFCTRSLGHPQLRLYSS